MKINPLLEKGRTLHGHWGSNPGDNYGRFQIIGPEGERLTIIASSGDGNDNIPWEHVSVSCRHRCPHWGEMCWVKDLFWDPEEAVIELHPPRSTWVNNHPYCLHLWRPLHGNISLPPEVAVGYKELNGVNLIVV